MKRAMAKKITVNDKLIGKIEAIISDRLCLSKVDEFQDDRVGKQKLFEERPEYWTHEENTIYEYTERVRSEIIADLKGLLENGNAR